MTIARNYDQEPETYTGLKSLKRKSVRLKNGVDVTFVQTKVARRRMIKRWFFANYGYLFLGVVLPVVYLFGVLYFELR